MTSQELYVGAMSGTSCDGIDVVLVDLKQAPFQILATFSSKYHPDWQKTLIALARAKTYNLNDLYTIDAQIGHDYASAINGLLATLPLEIHNNIQAIGMHGQTIRHCPDAAMPFTVQLGCASTVAAKTNLPVIADFRRKDVAKGGQGAPLAPIFHQHAFTSSGGSIAVINIGGISNISVLTKEKLLAGFDIGPGNVIIDALAHKYFAKAYDEDGKLAAQGKVNSAWLTTCLSDPYFKAPWPKSTGGEHFNLNWFLAHMPKDVQDTSFNMLATATELTAQAIADVVNNVGSDNTKISSVYICGGGAHNSYLCQRIAALTAVPVATTDALGIAPQHVEAATFAWLAQQTWRRRAVDLSTITGSQGSACLGGIYLP